MGPLAEPRTPSTSLMPKDSLRSTSTTSSAASTEKIGIRVGVGGRFVTVRAALCASPLLLGENSMLPAPGCGRWQGRLFAFCRRLSVLLLTISPVWRRMQKARSNMWAALLIWTAFL